MKNVFNKVLYKLGLKTDREKDVIDELLGMYGLGDYDPMIPQSTTKEEYFLAAIAKRMGQILDTTSEATRAAQLLSMAAIIISIVALLRSCGTPYSMSELEQKQTKLQIEQIELLKEINKKLDTSKLLNKE